MTWSNPDLLLTKKQRSGNVIWVRYLVGNLGVFKTWPRFPKYSEIYPKMLFNFYCGNLNVIYTTLFYLKDKRVEYGTDYINNCKFKKLPWVWVCLFFFRYVAYHSLKEKNNPYMYIWLSDGPYIHLTMRPTGQYI